jgi:hypothetical protein
MRSGGPITALCSPSKAFGEARLLTLFATLAQARADAATSAIYVRLAGDVLRDRGIAASDDEPN